MEHHLTAALEGTLVSDLGTRSQAEAALLQAHTDASCGIALCKIVLSTHYNLQLRQSAAISLRRWIRERWSPIAEGFLGFPPTGLPVQSQDKGAVRQALLHILGLPGQSVRKLRAAAAACLSLVCSSDWPDEFPELLPTVHQMLQPVSGPSTERKDRVDGALAFLTEFWTSEMDERQILGGAKDVLPTIEALLADAQTYPASLRSRCVLIFRQLLSSLFMVKDTYPEVSKQIAEDVLPRWVAALEAMSGTRTLAATLASSSLNREEKHGELCLANEVWRTLKIASHFRVQLKTSIPGLLTSAIQLLQQLEPAFSTYYLEQGIDPPFAVSDDDSDIETSLPSLLCSIIDFIAEAKRGNRGRAVFLIGSDDPSDTTNAMMKVLISYARITAAEEIEWSSDANAFVAASEEDAVEYGLRVAATDLCQDMVEAYPNATLKSLGVAVESCIGDQTEWKRVEAALAILGGVAEEIHDLTQGNLIGNSSSPNVDMIFQQAVLPALRGQVPALLTGRAYIFASQFAASLPADLGQHLLDASVRALETNASSDDEEALIVKLSAVRCIRNFYRQLSSPLLAPFTGRIIAELGSLLMQANEETLVLILETIQCVIGENSESQSADSCIAAETYAEITRAVLTIWRSNVKDFLLLSVISDLLESLASQRTAGVATGVVTISQSLLVAAIQAAIQSQTKEEAEVLEPAVTLTHSLLMGASTATIQGCQCASQFLGSLCAAVEATEDRDVLQSGISALTILVRKSPVQVVQWRDGMGSSLDHFTAIISRVLLLEEESAGLKAGEFIIALLRRMPEQMLPILPSLLDGMVRRLSRVKTASFAQSLIVPFAFLIKDQCNQVVDLLRSITISIEDDERKSQTQASGLAVLCIKWMENAETIQGYWAQKISTLALTRLLQSGDASLAEIMVKGDLIPDNSNTIRTRSKAKASPHQFTYIPLPAKILKLAIAEYDSADEIPPWRLLPRGVEREDDEDPDEADDDDGDEWADDEPTMGTKDFGQDRFLSSLLNANMDDVKEVSGTTFEVDEGDEGGSDNDEVWNMDLKAHLAEFFQQLAQSPQASMLASHLQSNEQQKLSAIIMSSRAR